MAIICHSYNLLFIMAPRTACTATGKVLLEELNGEWLPEETINDDIPEKRIPQKHTTLEKLLSGNVLSPSKADSLFKFVTVRNPFDSLVSLYIKLRQTYQPLLSEPNSWVYKLPNYVKDMEFCTNHSFDEWVIQKYKPGYKERILGGGRKTIYGKYTKGVDAIMKFENLQSDFQAIQDRIGISKKVSIPVFNKTAEKQFSYRQYYSEKSRKIVEYVFREELTKYGYEF
jgi:hypothetical protein